MVCIFYVQFEGFKAKSRNAKHNMQTNSRQKAYKRHAACGTCTCLVFLGCGMQNYAVAQAINFGSFEDSHAKAKNAYNMHKQMLAACIVYACRIQSACQLHTATYKMHAQCTTT